MPTRRRGPLNIAEYFDSLEDPRVVGRSTHPLLTIIAMALVGVICGANGWDDIKDIAVDRKEWLASVLEMPNGIPSADTFRRVLGALHPQAFTDCMSAWVQSLAEPLGGQVVAFDGKTIRGALKRTPWGTMMHQVHVWSCKQRLLLSKVGVAGAPEELDAVRRLLDLVDLRGAIVTADAAHCCAETAAKIVEVGAEYVLHLKANRATAYGCVDTFFQYAQAQSFARVEARHHRTEATRHGRTEIREAWSVPIGAVPWSGVDWPHLRSATMIERTRAIGEKVSVECHYYLSSLPPSVRKIADAVRQHWDVENGLHWMLDVQMGEDACAIHDEVASQNFGTLRRMSLAMLQRETSLKRGIAARRAKAARNTEYLERVLRRGMA
jgi:predicted transposase YbfD/YdcC